MKKKAAADALRVVLYARVSSEEQARKETIADQITVAKARSERTGIKVIRTYADDGVSGTLPLESRPEGGKLLADAERGLFDAVLVRKVARLGRFSRVSHNARFSLEEIGLFLIVIDEAFDLGTPGGNLSFGIFAAFAEHERAIMLERFTEGRLRRAERGQSVGGRPPYGYKIGADGKLVVSEEPVPGLQVSEAEIVRNVFTWVAEESLPLFAVCEHLNSRGIPRPSH